MKKILCVFIFVAMGLCQILLAEETGGKRTPNYFRGLILPKGKMIIVSKTMYFKKIHYYEGSTRGIERNDWETTMIRENLMIRRGLGHNFDIKLQIPVVKKISEASFGKDDNFGLADMMIFFQYGLWAQKKKDPWALAAYYSVTLPTGHTHVSSSVFNKPGVLDLGSGAFANMLELKLRKEFGDNMFFVSNTYRIALSEGCYGYKDGDEWGWILSYTRYLENFVSIKTELTGEVVADSKTYGVTQNDGSSTIGWLVGLGGRVTSDLSYDLSVEFPIYRYYDDNDLEPDFKLFVKLVWNL